MHTLLVCTVGGTVEPLVRSLLHWRPARVLFVPSAETRGQVQEVLDGYAREAGQPLGPGAYRVRCVDDAQDIQGCLSTIRALDQEVEEWLARGADCRIVADYTAGTKCMSAALALEARRWPASSPTSEAIAGRRAAWASSRRGPSASCTPPTHGRL
jgi:hypothetical protein